jgi:regulator of sirC expression with transglutaminase-like and TPR domain
MSTSIPENQDRLRAILSANNELLNLGEAALRLAHLDLPKINLATYLSELDLIAKTMQQACSQNDTLLSHIKILSETIFDHHGYSGDTKSYDDPQNANLIRVIDRRKGLPVALGILIIHASRSQGWNIQGINFPGHFLLRITKAGEHVLVDPFNKSRLLAQDELQKLLTDIHGSRAKLQPEFFRITSDRNILNRLQNNIKTRALHNNNPNHAIKILHSMTLIQPKNPGILAELALLESSEGSYRSAIKKIKNFIKQNPNSEGKSYLINLKDNLLRKLN